MIIFLSTFIDYSGMAFFPSVYVFRCIGRLAFPLCCYLIAMKIAQDGFTRTFFLAVLALALLSEIPFDMLRFTRFTLWNEQNPVFALVICTILCGIIRSEQLSHSAKLIFSLTLILLSLLTGVSYGWLGPALCTGFLLTEGDSLKSFLVALLLPAFYVFLFYLSGIERSWLAVSLCMSLSAFPILLFRNLRFSSNVPLILLGVSYPLQMICLVAVRNLHLIPPYLFD